MKEIFCKRRLLYAFLSRGFLKEVDAEYLETVKKINYADFSGSGFINDGLKLLGEYILKSTSGTLLDLARDYARTFLGAGLAQNEGAYPYESVYTSPDRLLMQEARDEVMEIYASEELGRKDNFVEPEDHIAFELEFMAFMCGKSEAALDSNDVKTVKLCLEKQKAFLNNHIGRWINSFCDDVVKVAREDFYRAFALIARGFIEEEKEVIGTMLNEYD